MFYTNEGPSMQSLKVKLSGCTSDLDLIDLFANDIMFPPEALGAIATVLYRHGIATVADIQEIFEAGGGDGTIQEVYESPETSGTQEPSAPCCSDPRMFTFSAKCSDCFAAGDYDGYVPTDMNIGGHDYVEVSYCLNCGQMAGTWPVADTTLLEDDE